MVRNLLFRAADCAQSRNIPGYRPPRVSVESITKPPSSKSKKKIRKKLTPEEQKIKEDTELRDNALSRLHPDQHPQEGMSLAACFLTADLVGCIPHNRVLREEIQNDPHLQEIFSNLINAHREKRAQIALLNEFGM